MPSLDSQPRAAALRRTLPVSILIAAAGCVALWFAAPPDPDRLVDQGLRMQQAYPAEAEHLFRRAIDMQDGACPDAQLALSCLLARRGAWDESTTQFAAIDKSVVRTDLLLEFGRIARAAERDELARTALEPLVDRGAPETSQALEVLADLDQRAGRQNDAIVVMQRLAQRHPTDFRRWRDLIRMLKAAYREQECLAAAREALQHDPPPEIWLELQFQVLEQLIVLGDSAEAWRVFAVLESTGEQSARLQSMRVDLLRMDGRLDEALQTITVIFPQVRDQPAAYVARGSTYLDLGRYEEAARDLERAVASQPFDERTRFKLSEAYRGLGRDEQSRDQREIGASIRDKRIRLNSLLQQSASSPQRSRLQELADLYRALGEADAAEFWQHRADRLRESR